MNGFIKLFCLLFAFSLLTSCIPTEIGTVAQCGPNEAYDAIKRICYNTTVPHQPPTPTLSRIDMIEDQAVQEFVLTYTDVDGDLATNCSIISRGNGIDDVTYNCQCQGGICTVKVQPDPDFSGYTELVYSLTDINGVSAGKSVAVYVAATNDAPIGSNQTIAVTEDIAKSFTLTATDQDGDSVYFVKLSDPAHGSVSFNGASGLVTYTPALNYNGTDTFLYKVCDYGNPTLCSPNYTVTFNIAAVDDAPVVANITGSVAEGGSSSITLSYTDVENDAATLCNATSPTLDITINSCVCAAGVCSLSVSSVSDFNGVINLSYTVTANGLTSVAATLATTVTPVNDAPIISLIDPSLSIAEGTVLDLTTANASFTLGEGGTGNYEANQSYLLNITWTTINPVPASATVVDKVEIYYDSVLKGSFTTSNSSTYIDLGDGTSAVDASKLLVKVTPKSYESGKLAFTFKAKDSEGLTTTASTLLNIEIIETNDPPVISTIDPVDMNEGDEPYTHAFTIEEGSGGTEDNQPVSFTLSSDNTLLLPVNNITAAYMHTSQTARTALPAVAGVFTVPTTFTPPATTDHNSGNYYLYLKLDPVDGVSGTANITLTASDGSLTSDQTFTVTVNPIGANHGGWNKISARGSRTDRFGNAASTAFALPVVDLEWNNFNTATSATNGYDTISGWRVFRRTTNQEYDWEAPLNGSTDIDANTLSYQDSTVTEDTVYYYTVRPVDSSALKLSIPTKEVFSEVRVYVPPANEVFIHRWMMNQEVCKMMLMTEITSDPAKRVDPTNNFRCPYQGPGETAGYYDIGKDLVVDAVEVGCPYSKAPTCSVNGCVGLSLPAVAASGSIFYNRTNGKCFLSDGAAWNEMDAVAAYASTYADLSNRSYLPPLTNISQGRANDFCLARSPLSLGGGFALPSRKEQIAYSSWDVLLEADQINTLENGQDISSASKCNSSAASGLTSGFSDIDVPNTSYLYSLPGSKTSQIRSLYTGSQTIGSTPLTNSCTSRYGLQDVAGNVAEWTRDRFVCYPPTHPKAYTCEALNTVIEADLIPVGTYILADAAAAPLNYYDIVDSFFDDYRLDGIRGPCQDSLLNDGICDSPMKSWAIEKSTNLAGHFIFPVGMPARTDYSINFPYSEVSNYLLPIGSSQGIEIENLHSDTLTFNTYAIYQAGTGITDSLGDVGLASVATGGSYLTTSDVGRYSMEFLPISDVGASAATQNFGSNYIFSSLQENEVYINEGIELVAQIRLSPIGTSTGETYIFTIVSDASATVSITNPAGKAFIVHMTSGTHKVQDIIDALNADSTIAATFLASDLTGDPSNTNALTGGPVSSSWAMRVKTLYPWWGAAMTMNLIPDTNWSTSIGYDPTASPNVGSTTIKIPTTATFDELADYINTRSPRLLKAVVKTGLGANSAAGINISGVSFAPVVTYRLNQAYSFASVCLQLLDTGGAAGTVSYVGYDGTCDVFTVEIDDGVTTYSQLDTYIAADTTTMGTYGLGNILAVNDYSATVGDRVVTQTDTGDSEDVGYRYLRQTMVLSSQLKLPTGQIAYTITQGAALSHSVNTAVSPIAITLTVPTTTSTFALENYINANLSGYIAATNLFPSDSIPAQTGTTGTGDLTITSKSTGELWNSQKVSYLDGATAGSEYAEYDSDHIKVYIEPGVTTATQVATALTSNAAVNALVNVAINNGNALQGTFSNIFLEGGVDDTPSKRSDVGLRCVAPVESVDYPADSIHTYSY